jgi:hypothetical protein
MPGDTFEVRTTGPLFNGEMRRELTVELKKLEVEISEEGLHLVKETLGNSMQHPTGNYMSHLTTTTEDLHQVVTDGGIIYGPWLEGVSSRNESTRFKGYAAFRKATQRLQQTAIEKANQIIGRFTERMN